MPEYSLRDQANLDVTLNNLDELGGGSALNAEQVRILSQHPAYLEERHPQHQRLSTAIRAYYEARFPASPNHLPDGG